MPSPRRSLTPCLLLLAACAGESGAPAGVASVSEWRLSPEPLLEIGVVEGDAAYQLHEVVGAVRLADGGVAVANDGTREVRFFDRDGRFIRAWGGAGDGPEQVRRIYALGRDAGDTLVVVDGGRRRFVRLTSDGRLLGAEPWPEDVIFPGGDWMGWRTVVRSDLAPGRRGRVAAALERIGAYDGPGYRYVRIDDAGRLWVRPAGEATGTGDSVDWRVYGTEGVPIARLRAPSALRLHDSGPGWVLGVWQDSLDVQHVRLYGVEGMSEGDPAGLVSTATAAPAEEPAFTPAQGDAMAETTALLRNMASLQEIFYSTRGSYTASLDSLTPGGDPIEVPEGLELALLTADERGWMAQTRHPASGATCLLNMMIGGSLRLVSPAGVFCWDAPAAAPAEGGAP